ACRCPAAPCSPASPSPSSRCRLMICRINPFVRVRVPCARNLRHARPLASRSGHAPHHLEGAGPMLGWALTFLVVALIAAVLGFGGIAGVSIEIAKIIFVVAVVLFLVSAIVGLVRGRSSPMP